MNGASIQGSGDIEDTSATTESGSTQLLQDISVAMDSGSTQPLQDKKRRLRVYQKKPSIRPRGRPLDTNPWAIDAGNTQQKSSSHQAQDDLANSYQDSLESGPDEISKQERLALGSNRTGMATPDISDLLQTHEEQLQGLEEDVRLNLFGWAPEEEDVRFDTVSGTRKRSNIPNKTHEQDRQQNRALGSDEEAWFERQSEDHPLPRKDSYACKYVMQQQEFHNKYWSRGQSLVAGGMLWTIEESNLFHQGLRRFGKHNVWAIQEFMKTRSLAEVVTMIETMEMELARRKSLGLKMLRLSEMPMATEVDDQVIAIEEECASRLVDREMDTFWKQHAKSPAESSTEVVDKTRLFNMRTLWDLTSRLYIQNDGAGMEREVVVALYDALKEWLTPVVKELVVLQYEHLRVTALLKKEERVGEPNITEMDVVRTLQARQLPLDTDAFFSTLHSRLKYLPLNDSGITPRTISDGHQFIPAASKDYGKKYRLNTSVDLAKAEAPDSDQDLDTDDGVLAEEVEGGILEAPPRPSFDPQSATSGVQQRSKIYKEQEPSPQPWETFWSANAREAWRRSTDDADKTAAGSLMAQRLYLEPLPTVFPSEKLAQDKIQRIVSYVAGLETKDEKDKRFLKSTQPGYGALPRNTSLLLDPTRAAPTTGYGIGKRDRGGLWQVDKDPHTLVNGSGYITVSDSDDEEEEELGCNGQLEADGLIERASRVLGREDVFPTRARNSKRRKRGPDSDRNSELSE
ncbi:hypothetical protein BGX29_000882 [Mortierella sp. GBA35]|nr:hypothetical protein BGX29_000882 [Mortierella sp. GBA35]